jgi:hypothetical protein
MFDARGVISVDANGHDAEELALKAIDAGAEDVQVQDGSIDVYTAPTEFESVREGLEQAGLGIASAELAMVPKTTLEASAQVSVRPSSCVLYWRRPTMSVAELEETQDHPRYHIDTSWFDENNLSFVDIVQGRMCDSCRERIGEEVEDRQPVFDRTAGRMTFEVKRVQYGANPIRVIRDCCSRKKNFIGGGC